MPAIIRTNETTYIGAEFQSANAYLRRNAWTAPIAVSATYIKGLTATSASVATNFTTFTHQPDFARIVSITPGGTTADVASGSYVITGTDIRDKVITDTLTFSANDTLKQVSVKAFKTITNVLLPIQDGAGATFSVGVEDGMGLDRMMSEDAVIDAYLDGVRETTAATVTFSATVISLNTIDPNTALNASKNLSVIFVTKELKA